jgi:hypothetical protein
MKIGTLIVAMLACFCLNQVLAEDLPGLHEPLKTVTKQYLVIQQKLASDSFDGVAPAAADMKKAMVADPAKPFAPDFVKAVDDLAAAKDLHTARLTFQRVSGSFIATLAQNQAQTGSLHSAFCPMVKAYWVQEDGKVIHNPYYGSAMSDCGEFQRQF